MILDKFNNFRQISSVCVSRKTLSNSYVYIKINFFVISLITKMERLQQDRRHKGGRGAMPPPPTFLPSKKKKGKQRKAKKTFKAENIKRLSLKSKLYCLSHSRASRIQNFSCRPTMVADNTSQCSMATAL